jgi:NADPH:quinone reductase-like Zn-dependent oxidoreductase
MKAIVQVQYGSPDVLTLKDVDKPVVKDDQVLVRVNAAAINIGDWHLLRGVPYAMRLASGLLKPKREIPGLDVVGQVEVTGENVEHFRPGDEVFGWCRGAFAEYACAAENNLLPRPANLTFEQAAAVGDSAFTQAEQRYDVMLDLVGSRSLSACRRALTPRGTYVVVGVRDMGRWFGLRRQTKALLLSPFVRQRMRVFVVRHNREDLPVLKELVEAGKVAPVIDRLYTLSEVPDALRHQGEGHAQGKIVITT